MSNRQLKYANTFRVMSIIAIVFGILSIKSGGMVLFTEGDAHQAAGNYVPFVLWFNFLAGFVYILAGIGLWRQHSFAPPLALAITLATVAVFIVFGAHVYSGGSYEMRTVVAMSLRSLIWFGITLSAYTLGRRQHTTTTGNELFRN